MIEWIVFCYFFQCQWDRMLFVMILLERLRKDRRSGYRGICESAIAVFRRDSKIYNKIYCR